ncbi:MAG: hypothetical protein IPN95_22480 [Bacteroidetes bacterium]|jgi:hypothetical protein|nr:hypothetical protein [Bacteroidota bacterium]
MRKYTIVVEKINEFISEFNNLLKEEYQIEALDLQQLENDAYFLNLNGKTWDTAYYPRCGGPGVYFYFASSVDDPSKLALYVGKASNNSNLGRRIDTHFNWRIKQGNLDQEGKDGVAYRIEMITSLPIEKNDTGFLAPALEEFLISKFSRHGEFTLFNSQGT